MAVIVETLDAAGNLVESTDAGGSSPSEPAAPASAEVEHSGESAPPVPVAAPASAEVEHPAESAPAPVGREDSEDSDTDRREVPRSVQKRLDKMARDREKAEQNAQALQHRYDREIAELRGQLEMQTRLMRGDEPVRQSLPLHQQPEPNREDYPDDDRWFRAVRDWDKAQLKAELVREQYQQAAQQEEVRQQQALQAREQAVRQQHADYDAQIATLAAKGLTTQVYQALMQHELGPDLGYYLAQHPEDLQRLAPLPPLHVWRELVRLEPRLNGNGSAPPAAPSVVTSSTAKPAPLTPVGSGGSGAPQIALDDPNVSQRDWEAAAEKQYPGIFGRRR